MKKIYLVCSNGMSTSMLASMMQTCANQHRLPVEILAYPQYDLPKIIKKEVLPDAILLGPQVKYNLEDIKEQYGYLHIPIIVIDQEDYGMLNAEKVLKKAIIAMKK
ncbi:MAG: PTS sugar transporter subunit IIB [Faecalibacillus sp.]